MSCSTGGHLFCRECAVSNLVAQGEEIKRGRRVWEAGVLEEERGREVDEVEARRRAVEDFERVQAGLAVGGHGDGRGGVKVGSKGTKRKFELDGEEVARSAREDVDRSKRLMAAEEGAKPQLPSFWVPSKIPENQKGERKTPKLHATCPAAAVGEEHEFSLKGLIRVKFTMRDEEKGKKKGDEVGSEQGVAVCPSCSKTLSNTTKAVLGRPCGHVLCKPCSDKFQRPPEKSAHDEVHDPTVRCYVCQEDVTNGRKVKGEKEGKDVKKEKKKNKSKAERGLVEISCEGTGFAGGGKAEVKKSGVVYQC